MTRQNRVVRSALTELDPVVAMKTLAVTQPLPFQSLPLRPRLTVHWASPIVSGEMESNSSPSPVSYDFSTHHTTSLGLGNIFLTTPCEETLQVVHLSLGQPQQHQLVSDSTVFEAAFWREAVATLVRDDVAVRYANLAVLTLVFAHSTVGLGGNYYGEALAYHGQALRHVRETRACQGSLRSAILCCMFFVIFEIMNGDTKAAEAHLWSGERMLHELQRTQPGSSGTANNLRGELRCALQFLMLQTDVPNLNTERAGYLEAFIRMATSPDRMPN